MVQSAVPLLSHLQFLSALQCAMAIPDPQNVAELKFNTRPISFEWSVDDFVANQPHMSKKVDSPKFPDKSLPQWFIRLRPRGKSWEFDTFGVYLKLKKAEKNKSTVGDVSLQFLNDDRTKICSLRMSKVKFVLGKGLGFSIKDDSNASIPLSDSGKLIIRVDIVMREMVVTDTHSVPLEIPKSSMSERWMNLLNSGEYADFIVESADGQEFPTHKAVLSASNPLYFGVMFTAGMNEAREERVKLPFDAEIVAALLEYLYTDAVVNLTSKAARLYAAAHQYQLDRLVAICSADLIQNLSIDNFVDSIRIAKLFGDDNLLSASKKFIDGQKFDVVQMLTDASFNGDQSDQHQSEVPKTQKPTKWDRIRQLFKGDK